MTCASKAKQWLPHNSLALPLTAQYHLLRSWRQIERRMLQPWLDSCDERGRKRMNHENTKMICLVVTAAAGNKFICISGCRHIRGCASALNNSLSERKLTECGFSDIKHCVQQTTWTDQT
jgi:hypothetical protein